MGVFSSLLDMCKGAGGIGLPLPPLRLVLMLLSGAGVLVLILAILWYRSCMEEWSDKYLSLEKEHALTVAAHKTTLASLEQLKTDAQGRDSAMLFLHKEYASISNRRNERQKEVAQLLSVGAMGIKSETGLRETVKSEQNRNKSGDAQLKTGEIEPRKTGSRRIRIAQTESSPHQNMVMSGALNMSQAVGRVTPTAARTGGGYSLNTEQRQEGTNAKLTEAKQFTVWGSMPVPANVRGLLCEGSPAGGSFSY